MKSSGIKQLASTFGDKPDVQLALVARAAVVEANENAQRRQRQMLEKSEISVTVPLGELARLYHLALMGASIDEAFDPRGVFASTHARLERYKLEMLGWEGEVVASESL
jgi:hypothetical protein